MQVLYQCDMRSLPADQAISAFYGGLYSGRKCRTARDDPFMEDSGSRGCGEKAGIDERLVKYSERWRIERMPAVDRNILRMAIFEMMQGETPPAVVIDEAIELARKFSGEGSAPFINGVLDSVRKEIEAEAS